MTPAVVMLIGLPGSGKTRLAQWLTGHSEVVVVSRDTIRAAMFPDCRYTMEEKLAAFEAMRAAISVTLRHGRSVCTDGITFASAADRANITAIAAAAGATVKIVWCDVPIAVAQRRIRDDRVTEFPDRTAELVTEVAGRFAPVPLGALRLDMTKPIDEIGTRLLGVLRE